MQGIFCRVRIFFFQPVSQLGILGGFLNSSLCENERFLFCASRGVHVGEAAYYDIFLAFPTPEPDLVVGGVSQWCTPL